MKKRYLLIFLLPLLFLTGCKKTLIVSVDDRTKIKYDDSLNTSVVRNNESSNLLIANDNYHYNGVIIDKKENVSLISKKYTYYCIAPGLLNSKNNPIELNVVKTIDETYGAKYIGTDKKNYIALYSFESDNEYSVVEKSESEEVRGEAVYSLSCPTVDSKTSTFLTLKEGILSNINLGYLSISIALNSNELGCAIYKKDGSFLGVSYSITDSSDKDIITDHVIANNRVIRYDYIYKEYLDLYEKNGDISRGLMGITVTNYENQFTYESPDGIPYVTITKVTKLSPASNKGIRAGEFIKKIDGVEIKRMSDLTYLMSFKNAGDKVVLEMYNYEGKIRTIDVVLS
ncbi:MAG: S1C family serine protease [Acholeplasmatales bacterium]|nr:S1C family serine protease [Acholeplasmatales bacterium]